ncbi:MAG: DSD1 family PLP-dependent enzyme [Desulfitobacteriaceae bacterium]
MDSCLIGLKKEMIPTPALVLDATILERNLANMSRYLSSKNVNLRPHIKTHKTAAIARLQMAAGAIGLCCATVGEAEAMASAGLDHILIANEVIGEDKIRRVINLARQVDLIVAIDNRENSAVLSRAAEAKRVKLGVVVDIDVGMGRCGVRSIQEAVALAKEIHQLRGIIFRGVMGYEGHAVFIEDRGERTRLGREANMRLVEGASAIRAAGIPVEIVSGAGTGTYDIAPEVPGMTEIQAGSYIFMDSTYEKIGLPFEQALTVLTTVVSRPNEDIVIFDAGMKSISVERSCPVVPSFPNLEILKLAEEHAKGRLLTQNKELRPGDKVDFVPSHCCTTVNLYDYMYVVRDEIVEAIWPITARGAH